jgi:hypothetical protein
VSRGRDYLTRAELVAEIERRFAALNEEREPMVPIVPKRAQSSGTAGRPKRPPEHRRVGLGEEPRKARQDPRGDRRAPDAPTDQRGDPLRVAA